MITYHVLGDLLVVHVEDKTAVVSRSDKRFGKVLKALQANELPSAAAIADLDNPYHFVLKRIRSAIGLE